MSRATTTAALALAVQIAVSVTLEIMGPGAVVGIAQSAATGPAQDAWRIPNVVLTTQDGARVRFYDDLIKGKFVLVSVRAVRTGAHGHALEDIYPFDTEDRAGPVIQDARHTSAAHA
jgi:hypothetical protein